MANTRTFHITDISGRLADTTIPAAPIAGAAYRDPSLSAAVIAAGIPFDTELDSAEWNQIWWEWSSLLDTIDRRGIPGWTNLVDYEQFSIAVGSNGVIYVADQASGPAASGGARDPAIESQRTGFWTPLGGTLGTVSISQTLRDRVLLVKDGADSTALQETQITVSANQDIAGARNIGASGWVGRSATSGIIVPSGTSAQRQAQPTVGEIRYNSTLGRPEMYYDDAWQALGFEPGDVKIIPLDDVTAGWLECDGRAIRRADFPALFRRIGSRYGNGDGSTTFNIPDYRGEFFRVWDHGRGVDPNASTRGNRGDGTTGDQPGTDQGDAFRSHTHTYTRTDSQNINITRGNDNPSISEIQTPGVATSSTGGSETRPRNVAVVAVIKT